MKKREYSSEMLRVWGNDIKRIEKMIRMVEKDPDSVSDEDYQIVLFPEDFLDLCAGKWHTKIFNS